jgi:hypothetical protein
MKIVEVESVEQMADPNLCYELNGRFYKLCWTCGKPQKVDYHQTRYDIQHEEEWEEEVFCDEECERKHLLWEFPRLSDALLAGCDDRYRELVIRRGVPNYMELAAQILTALDLDADEDDIAAAEDAEHLTINVGRDGNTYMWYLDADEKEICVNVKTGTELSAEEIKKQFC